MSCLSLPCGISQDCRSGPIRTKLSLGTLDLPHERPNKIMSSNPSRGQTALISAEGRRARFPDFISYIQLQSSGSSCTSTSMTWDLTRRSNNGLLLAWLWKSSQWRRMSSQALSGSEMQGRWALWDRPPVICINPLMWQWHMEGNLALHPLAADGSVKGSTRPHCSPEPRLTTVTPAQSLLNLWPAPELCMEKKIQCEMREMLITMSN